MATGNLDAICPWRPKFGDSYTFGRGCAKQRWPQESARHVSLETKFVGGYTFLSGCPQKCGDRILHAICPWRPNVTPRQPASPAVHEVSKLTNSGGDCPMPPTPVARRSSQIAHPASGSNVTSQKSRNQLTITHSS